MAIRPRGKAKRTPRPTLKPKGIGNLLGKALNKRKQIGKAGAKALAMGGQASESLARSEVMKDMRKRQQDKLNRMLERLYGKDEIKPKKKPKKPGNLKTLKSKPKKPGNLRFSK